jgi:protein TonB
MKTIQNVFAPAITISFDEFIFYNRNHAYGAFELRKEYKKRLFFAFIFAFVLFGTTICIPLIESYFIKPVPPPRGPVTIEQTLTKIEPIVIPPPPAAPDLPSNLKKSLGYAIPEIVDTLNENEPTMVSINPDEIGGDIDANIDYTKYEPIPVDVALADTKEEEPITFVQEPATYDNGSPNNFSKWIGNNLTLPGSILDIGLSGKTFVQFVVNKNGELSDIQITRSMHPTLDEEIIRTIQNAPKKWTVAKHNGRPVRQRLSISIFVQAN